MLNEDVNGPYRDQHRHTAAVAGAGAVAVITSIDAGSVEAVVADYDGGTLAFGPVPCVDLSGSLDAVATGDEVFLLVASDGEPYAALKIKP